MKKILFGLLATVLFSVSGNAQNNVNSENEVKSESAIMTVKSGNEVVKYNFNSIKDFEENTDQILDDIAANASTNKADKCEVTVEISVTVNTGVVSTTLTATVTAPCATIATTVKKIRAQLIAAIT